MNDTAYDPIEPDEFLDEERRDPVVRLLELSRIPVAEGFADRVAASLDRPRWKQRRCPVGVAATAAAALLAILSTLLLRGSDEASLVGSTLAAIGDLASATLLAGAGLAGASWSFLSLPARAAFGDSAFASIATVGVLLALGLGLWRALRRRPAAAVASADRRERR